MNVFIVENSVSLRERLTLILAGLKGVRVVGHAATAAEAVQKIGQTSPDVVILDIRLDEGTGFEVLEKIKVPHKRPIIVVLTNYPYPQYRVRYMRAGADFFFDKSTELDSALQVLKDLGMKGPLDGAT